MQTKFIVLTGGVCSSTHRGIGAALGAVLKAHGYRITAVKIDPFLNIDAGSMTAGEVFVLADGSEVGAWMGPYSRIAGLEALSSGNNITLGKLYKKVIDKERSGSYLGKTVQMLPHISDEIVNQITEMASIPTDGTQDPPQICIVDLGGTVGDFESMIFIEALRMLRFKIGPSNFCLVHCSVVPTMSGQKTKPTQHTVRMLSGMGLLPDILVCKCDKPLSPSLKSKISSLCSVSPQCVISIHRVPSPYHLPLTLYHEGILSLLTACLELHGLQRQTALTSSPSTNTMSDWEALAGKKEETKKVHQRCRIAIIEKFAEVEDIDSLNERKTSLLCSIDYSAIDLRTAVHVVWIDANDFKDPSSPRYTAAYSHLKRCGGVIMTTSRGVTPGHRGKLKALQLIRTEKIPFLGLSQGMHLAILEFSKNVCGINNASSPEFHPNNPYSHFPSSPHAGGNTTMNRGLLVVDENEEFLDANLVIRRREVHEQRHNTSTPTHPNKGDDPLNDSLGSETDFAAFDQQCEPVVDSHRKLGTHKILVEQDTQLHSMYKATEIEERYNNAYEVDPSYYNLLREKGLVLSAWDEHHEIVEAIELPKSEHPFFVAVQFHAEYLTQPRYPSVLINGLLSAVVSSSPMAPTSPSPSKEYNPELGMPEVSSSPLVPGSLGSFRNVTTASMLPVKLYEAGEDEDELEGSMVDGRLASVAYSWE